MNERSFLFYANCEFCQEEKDLNYIFCPALPPQLLDGHRNCTESRHLWWLWGDCFVQTNTALTTTYLISPCLCVSVANYARLTTWKPLGPGQQSRFQPTCTNWGPISSARRAKPV